MASVEIHGDIGEVEIDEGVVGALQIRGLGVAAFGDVEVRHKVGQGVGLDDQDDAGVAVRDELLPDRIDVRLVVGHAAVRNAVLAVGSGCRAVAIGKIVDDKQARVRGAGTGLVGGTNVGKRLGHQGRDLGGSVTIISNISSLQICCSTVRLSRTYSHWKVGTLATAAALVAIAPVKVGIAYAEISDA